MAQRYFGKKSAPVNHETGEALLFGALLWEYEYNSGVAMESFDLGDPVVFKPTFDRVRRGYFTEPGSDFAQQEIKFDRFVRGLLIGHGALRYAVRNEKKTLAVRSAVRRHLEDVFTLKENPRECFKQDVLYVGQDCLRQIEKRNGKIDAIGFTEAEKQIDDEPQICTYRSAVGFVFLAAAATIEPIHNPDLRVYYDELVGWQSIGQPDMTELEQ